MSDNDRGLRLAEPSGSLWCEVEDFARLLAGLRRAFPRVHYTSPCFAAFCRGERIQGTDVALLRAEVAHLRAGLAEVPPTELRRLDADSTLDTAALYRLAHYRGRTFDREHTTPLGEREPKPVESRAALTRTLDVLAHACGAAGRAGGAVAQAPHPGHTPPPPAS